MFILFSKSNFIGTFTEKIESRISVDTRSDLYDRFYKEMRENLVFGKGMNGTYFSPIYGNNKVDGIIFNKVVYRNVIENGYLQLLLTGGIVHIVFFFLVMLPATYLGIFRSSNQFAKACGSLILLQLLNMFLYGLPTLSLSYVLVWVCVGVCYKPSIRKKSNDDIRIEFEKIGIL